MRLDTVHPPQSADSFFVFFKCKMTCSINICLKKHNKNKTNNLKFCLIRSPEANSHTVDGIQLMRTWAIMLGTHVTAWPQSQQFGLILSVASSLHVSDLIIRAWSRTMKTDHLC